MNLIRRGGCISALAIAAVLGGSIALLSAASVDIKEARKLTAELVTAAHRVLDLGYDCHVSGASREACHAQLTTALREYVRQ